jgi:hypothetical protein
MAESWAEDPLNFGDPREMVTAAQEEWVNSDSPLANVAGPAVNTVDLAVNPDWTAPGSSDRLIYPQSDGILFLESFGPKEDSDAPAGDDLLCHRRATLCHRNSRIQPKTIGAGSCHQRRCIRLCQARFSSISGPDGTTFEP